MIPITLCKKNADVPNSFAPNSILMNGGDKPIQLRQEKIVEKIIEVDKTYFKTFKGIQQGKSLKELADFANRCNCVGAVLSYDENKMLFTIWNGDPTDNWWNPYDYDETPEEYNNYGTAIAACIGKGVWVVRDGFWRGTDMNTIKVYISGSLVTFPHGCMNWAPRGTNLFSNCLYDCIRGDGWSNTNYIMTSHASEIMNMNQDVSDGDNFNNWTEYYNCVRPIWFQLSQTTIPGLKTWIFDYNNDTLQQIGDFYIPSIDELRVICLNCSDHDITGEGDQNMTYEYKCNLAKFICLSTDYWYWSSSQHKLSYEATALDFLDGDINDESKNIPNISIVCVHFPDTTK